MAGTLAPCFIPATLLAAGVLHKVSVTRLGADRAQLSGDVPCAVGERLQLEMDRPTDGLRIRVLVHVTAVKREGAQWGWKPSIHVRLELALERALVVADGDEMSEDNLPGEEPSLEIVESQEAPPAEVALEIEDDDDLHQVADGPSQTDDESFSFEVAESDLDMASITLPEFGDSGDDDESEPEFVPEVIEPQVHTLDDIVPEPTAEVQEEPPSASTSAETHAPWDTAEITTPPWEDYADPATESLSTGIEAQPPKASPRRPGVRTPWDPSQDRDSSEAEREARIVSQVTVSYLCAGKKRFGTAQDFSRRGMFVAVPDKDPLPLVGAIVRVGFPIELPHDLVVARMTTEVRWSYGEDSPNSPGRGVGLQISAFDTAAEQRQYEAYARSIIDNTPGPREPLED